MQVEIKKKSKRKLKKGFKIILIFILFVLILISAIFIFKNHKKISEPVHTTVGDNSSIADNENDLDPFSKLFKLRLPSQHLEYSSSSEISQNGDMKIYLRNTNQDSGYLFVNTNDDPYFVWITFVSAIAAEPLKSSLINDLSHLNYVDLRFKNKIFYKFDNKYNPTLNSTSSTSTR